MGAMAGDELEKFLVANDSIIVGVRRQDELDGIINCGTRDANAGRSDIIQTCANALGLRSH